MASTGSGITWLEQARTGDPEALRQAFADAGISDNRHMASTGSGVTWLEQARTGDPEALRQAFADVYGELRRLAHGQLIGQAGRTLETTGLVHEAFLRLVGHQAPIRDRGHFFALAARVMRQVIVDFARERLAAKRGGGERPIPLDDVDPIELKQAEEMIALDEVLQQLAATEPRQASVVECRYFAGLTEPETAEALGISVRSVQRDWHLARDWLRLRLA